MTPEERARATLNRRGDDVDAYLKAKARGERPPHVGSVDAYVASAIREAEDAALEKAAEVAARAWHLMDIRERLGLSAEIRSLKHPSSPREGDRR